MKIYFAGSIRGGRDDADLYYSLIQYINTKGEVLTEHIGDKKITSSGERNLSEKYIHDRDMKWIMEADVIVAEVTQPSLGVGYELGRAVENGKKILCMFRPVEDRKLSAMIAGCDCIVNKEYNNLEDAKKILDEFFKGLE